MYKLLMDKRVISMVSRLQAKQYKQVVNKILSLQANPRPQDYKSLKRYKNGYRVDQGEYRILYTINDEEQLVTIWQVGHRRDVYRNL